MDSLGGKNLQIVINLAGIPRPGRAKSDETERISSPGQLPSRTFCNKCRHGDTRAYARYAGKRQQSQHPSQFMRMLLKKARGETTQAKATLPPSSLPVSTPEGTELLPAERLKAKDLRTALLLGKIPEDSGINSISHSTGSPPRPSCRHEATEPASPRPGRANAAPGSWRWSERTAWTRSTAQPRLTADCQRA
jgi:hypothetical protein